MRHRWKRRRVGRVGCVIAVMVAVAMSASTAGAAAKSTTKPETSSLNIPLSGSSAAVGYLQFAAEKGYYDKYGLSVTAPASDNATVKSALVAGASPLAGLATVDVLGLISSGVKLEIIGCQQLSVPFQMWATSDIKTAKDLKGKTIGVTGLTSSLGISTLQYLTANKMTASDVTIVPLGSVPNLLAALTSGRIDASLLSYPSYVSAAASGGLHKVGDAPAAPNIYVASTDWAKANHNTIVSYLKGNTEGLVAYATDRTAALPVLAKLLRLNLDDPVQGATVREGYQLYHASFTPIQECTKSSFDAFVPYLTPEQQATLEKPAKLLDNSYVQKLTATDFYAKLTKKYGAFPGLPQ
jgi:ABC-type nitrate/sulfonate/bicarbonate transport system substrate-binding protein